MFNLSFWGIIFYLLSIMALSFLAAAANSRFRLNKFANYAKKFFWAILIACAGYWFLTVPFVGRRYDASFKSDYPAELTSQAGEVKYLREHQQRIEELETEVKDTREELKVLQEHYQVIIQFFFYAILYYGVYQIFNSKNEGPERVEKDKVLNL